MPDPTASSEPGSNDSRTTTQWRQTSRYYRRRPGLAWLIGLALIPLLLGVIGYGTLDASRSQDGGQPEPGGALPTLTEPPPGAPPPGLGLAPLSVVWHGNAITLDGSLPDQAAKRALLDLVIASVGEEANIIDNLGLSPGRKALDFSRAGPVFEAARTISDFTLVVNGETVTISGAAAATADEQAIGDAAVEAFPNVNIVNEVQITGPVRPTAAPGNALAPDHRIETVVS